MMVALIGSSNWFLAGSGFLFGSTYNLDKKKIKQSPNTTILSSIFDGFVGMFGTLAISRIMPAVEDLKSLPFKERIPMMRLFNITPYRYIFPIMFGIVWTYHKLFEENGPGFLHMAIEKDIQFKKINEQK
jgi:hypothetical protein